MFQVFALPETNFQVERLEELSLPLALEGALHDASKISHRLGVDVSIYNFTGHRKIKKYSGIDFLDEKIPFMIMEDDRIAVEGSKQLSAIFQRDRAVKNFKKFQELGLSITKDETGIHYFEKKLLPYSIMQGHMTHLGNLSRWVRRDWKLYFDLWENQCSTLWPWSTYKRFHFLSLYIL